NHQAELYCRPDTLQVFAAPAPVEVKDASVIFPAIEAGRFAGWGGDVKTQEKGAHKRHIGKREKEGQGWTHVEQGPAKILPATMPAQGAGLRRAIRPVQRGRR